MRTLVASISGLLLLVPACKGDDKPKDETKSAKADAKDAKAEEDEGEPTLQVAVGDEGVDGPVPPETNMVLPKLRAIFPDASKYTIGGSVRSRAHVPPF